jgi:tetratricopeptide (TPR) repeat protein
MKRLFQIIPLLAVAMLIAVPTFAQTGSIQGKVLNKEGQPYANVLISIDRLNITGHFEVRTGADGAFFHAGLPTGQYKVSVMENNVPVDLKDNIRVNFGGATTVDFDLRSVSADAERAAIEAENKRAEETRAAFEQARLAVTAKNWEEAARLFQLAATADPTQHVIFGNMAMALTELRKYDEAAAAYRKAIELAPLEAVYYNNLGSVLGNAGKAEEASEVLQKAAEMSPTTAGQAYYNLGAIYTNRGRVADAVGAFKKAIEFDPNMAEAYYQLGVSLLGSPATIKEAVPALEKYLQLAPNGPNAAGAQPLLDFAKSQ